MAAAPASAATLRPAPSRRFLAVAAALGGVAFGVACWIVDALARGGTYGNVDDALFVTPFWQFAVDVLGRGQVPYRDFPLEYPPLGLPAFLLPGLLPGGLDLATYRSWYELQNTIVGMLVVPVVVITIRRLGGSRAEVLTGTGLVAVTPLLLGPLMVSRYDLWPALLAGLAVAALLWDRHRLGFGLLALAVLAKAYPIVLAPIFLAWAWRRAGRHEAFIALGVGLAVGLAGLAPFLAVDVAGALDPFARALSRPLQVESLGAAALITLHRSAGLDIGPLSYAFGSYNLEGDLASAAGSIQSAILAVGLGGTWLVAARGASSAGRFVTACAAALTVEVAFGKVLSAQYVMWLIPAVVVVLPARGSWPLAGLAGILMLTAWYYPGMYQVFVTGLDQGTAVTILARDLGLVVLALALLPGAGLAGALRGVRASARHGRPGSPRIGSD